MVVATCQNNVMLLWRVIINSHAIILWPGISVKLNIGKKIAGLEIIALNLEKT